MVPCYENQRVNDYSISLRRNEQPKPVKEKKSCKLSLHSMFAISNKENVHRLKLKGQDFDLPKETHVAEYDKDLVAKYWNNTFVEQSMYKGIFTRIMYGILGKTIPVITVYIVAFYVINIFIVNPILCTNVSTSPSTEERVHLALAPANTTCNKDVITKWATLEGDFTRVLTFFIGFYVSFTIRNWWDQVRSIPRFDGVCISLNSFLWVDPSKNEAKVRVKGDLTAKDLRVTIARYYLLSWTMCLSRISTKMNRNFKDAKDYNIKRLLNKREYDELRSPTGSDCWLEKWTTPLLWIQKMAQDLGKETTDPKLAKIKDFKELGNNLTRFRQDLDRLNSFTEYQLPQGIIQALTIATYCFFIILVLSGQAVEHETSTYVIKSNYKDAFVTFFEFPLFAIVKYIMLFGWLKTAADLQNPFGDDHEDVDLPGFLDYEIWKSSYMLAQNIPLRKELAENDTEWHEFGPRWQETVNED